MSGEDQPAAAELPLRLRFAKREIAKALEALELADSSELTAWMRVLDLEDRLADERELAAEWRRKYEALRRLLANGKGET